MCWHSPTVTQYGEVMLYYEPDIEVFVTSVLQEFDLDICRNAIYDEHYYTKFVISLSTFFFF